MQVLWIGLGGFIGANMRYWLGSGIARMLGSSFPWATGLVNITGALAIGILATLFADRAVTNESLRLFLIVGILGGYTTFSSYTMEGVAMMLDGRWGTALAYIIGSNVVGILACALGVLIARSWVS